MRDNTFTEGDYTININNHRRIRILFGKKCIGGLYTKLLDDGWVEVISFHVNAAHRGKGLGTLLYKYLFMSMPEEEKGIKGHVNRRMNTVEIPKLCSRFGGTVTDNGEVFIPKTRT